MLQEMLAQDCTGAVLLQDIMGCSELSKAPSMLTVYHG